MTEDQVKELRTFAMNVIDLEAKGYSIFDAEMVGDVQLLTDRAADIVALCDMVLGLHA
jgi:hypothetical protein